MNKQDKKEIMNLIKYKKMLGGRRMDEVELTDNTKIEELDMNEFAQGNEIDYRIAFKLNEVIRKINKEGNNE